MARKKGWGRGQPRSQRANTYGALAAHDGGIDSGKSFVPRNPKLACQPCVRVQRVLCLHIFFGGVP